MDETTTKSFFFSSRYANTEKDFFSPFFVVSSPSTSFFLPRFQFSFLPKLSDESHLGSEFVFLLKLSDENLF